MFIRKYLEELDPSLDIDELYKATTLACEWYSKSIERSIPVSEVINKYEMETVIDLIKKE